MRDGFPEVPAHIHVSGVGGVGMNAIAQLLLSRGYRVTGSDRFLDQGECLPVLDALAGLGISLVPQDGTVITSDTRALVLSTAVESTNPERVRARALGVPEVHRAAALAHCVGGGRLVAIAGTSGKTTCTGWLGRVLEVCGLEPTVVNGGGVLNWKTLTCPGNVRLGADPAGWWVVEVDESDGSLLRFDPEVALITGMSPDHHSEADTLDLFGRFARKVRKTIVCGPGVKEVLAKTEGIRAELVSVGGEIAVDFPGAHNRQNAASVVAMAEACGVSREAACAALAEFSGVERRLERCSPMGSGVQVFDDYAHNPEKIAAAIRAVRPSGGGLVACWRPHGFAPLRQNFEALLAAFAENLRSVDRALILPVFYAGGTAPEGPQGEDFAEALQARGVAAQYLDTYPDRLRLAEGDVLLVMGARDPELPRFAARMGAAARDIGNCG